MLIIFFSLPILLSIIKPIYYDKKSSQGSILERKESAKALIEKQETKKNINEDQYVVQNCIQFIFF